MAVFARRTRVRARRRTCQYVEHPGRVQRGENSQIRVRSRESVKFPGLGGGVVETRIRVGDGAIGTLSS